MTADRQQFREALAHWASGVTIVSTVKEGFWKGATASAFTSVSLEPPMVLIALDRRLYTRQLIAEAGCYAVSILGAQHERLARIFAGMHPEIEDRYAQAAWRTAETGAPILEDASGWVDCTVEHTVESGDHTLFIGRVLACGAATQAPPPLLYHRRLWGSFQPFAAEGSAPPGR